jgi:hypothetical protein
MDLARISMSKLNEANLHFWQATGNRFSEIGTQEPFEIYITLEQLSI